MRAEIQYSHSTVRQRGYVLMIALIALIAMTLAAVGMIRSTDTASQIAGNLAFRSGAMQAGDIAFNEAIQWLNSQSAADLTKDKPSVGYYATDRISIEDFTNTYTVDWEADNDDINEDAYLVNDNQPDAQGNRYAYFIHRMCEVEGAISVARCVQVTMKSGNESKKSPDYIGGGYGGNVGVPYYRITVRVSGPRNAVSYLQMFVVI